MATALDREVRRLLDKAVRRARTVAEDGARKALTELGVEDTRKPDRLSAERAELRNRLRAHAQSLGDVKAFNDSIKANRLVREIAYEHWHRALFARFLAENDLLIDPDHKVAVSLSELEEIAKEEGRDLVELAADWAEPMLPQIFRKDDPVLAIALPPETKTDITEIVKGLPRAVFAAADSLGWVYQFWQADQKERINDSDVKIGADELPSVTQLFTEDYMVLFLLENTLGAWWAGKVLAADPTLGAGAASEDELREKASPPGYSWTHLRFVRQPRDGETHETATGPWRPAAGAFEGWPKAAKQLTVLDPCMGSGHFLVFALPILVAFRRAEEGIDDRAAVKAVLADNLFGLEIDPRCTQIAAFALALASWKRLGGPEPLPRLNLACSGLAIGLGKVEFLKLADKIATKRGWKPSVDLLGDGATPIESAAIQREREGLSRLYDLFEKAPFLGSLIDPRRAGGDLFAAGYDSLAEILGEVLEAGGHGYEIRELAVTAQGLAKAAEILGRRCTLVATNVPYLGTSAADARLSDSLEVLFQDARDNIAACFFDRFCMTSTVGAVTTENWLFLVTFAKFRRHLLTRCSLRNVSRIGERGFESSQAAGAFTALVITDPDSDWKSAVITGFDVSSSVEPSQKAVALRVADGQVIEQPQVFANPDHVVAFGKIDTTNLFSKYGGCFQGVSPGDGDRVVRDFFELAVSSDRYKWYQTPSDETELYSGRSRVIQFDVLESGDVPCAIRGREAWGKRGVSIGQMRSLPGTLYTGELFSNSTPVIVTSDQSLVPAVWAFHEQGELGRQLRSMNPKVSVDNGYVNKIPFDAAHWRKAANHSYPNGLPKPYSNDPTQWLFDGHPRGGGDPNVTADSATNPYLLTPHGRRPGMAEHPLQVAVARLLGYRWPRQTGSSFMDCPAMPGPDEVDQSGLVDADGIVPLPALAGEADAATRLRDLIRAAWRPDYGERTIRELLAAEDAKVTDLGAWLADEFFDGHCSLFHQTPFIWHVWDGRRGGFSALVNYHRLCEGSGAGRRLLEKLRDSYLGEWIAAQRRMLAAGEAGAEDRLIAAEHLRGELTKIIEGEPPYDIFVRWKPLHRQPIGWEPDIDDGVRLNIRPFLTARPKNSGRKDGCILRVTPRVKKHAGADRGAEPHREKDAFPWFWADDADVAAYDFGGGPSFKGRRYNDFHYTKAFKQRARDAKADILKGVA